MTGAEALELLVTLVKGFEGCSLRAYPDPASPLGRAMGQRGLMRAYMKWRVNVPPDLRHLSGAPWTCGYGETLGVKEGDVWSQDYAELRLRHELALYMQRVLAKCPELLKRDPRRAIACTSLAYNIGVGAFGASSVCRHTKRREFDAAAQSFLLWNKAGGAVMAGLTKRRKLERLVYQLLYKS